MAKRRYDISEAPRGSWAWWSRRLRTLLWVSVVTVLIWIYADTQVSDTEKIAAVVDLTTGNSPSVVLLSPARYRVSFIVSGSRASLKKFSAKYSNAVIPYDLSRGYSPGWDQAIPTKDIVNSLPDLTELGLKVDSASPTAITGVHLDAKVHKVVPVEFVYTGAELRAKPQLSMGVSLAESNWKQIEDGAVLQTVRKDLSNEKTNEEIPVEAEIIPSIRGVSVEGDQKTLQFKIFIEEFTASATIPVTVKVLTPAHWLGDGTWQQYVLKWPETQEWRQPIEFTGPKKDVERLTAEDVDAYIVLAENDKTPLGSWLPREVVVNVRKKLNVKVTAVPTMQFKLEKLPDHATP